MRDGVRAYKNRGKTELLMFFFNPNKQTSFTVPITVSAPFRNPYWQNIVYQLIMLMTKFLSCNLKREIHLTFVLVIKILKSKNTTGILKWNFSHMIDVRITNLIYNGNQGLFAWTWDFLFSSFARCCRMQLCLESDWKRMLLEKNAWKHLRYDKF